jgi:hypothetical protein
MAQLFISNTFWQEQWFGAQFWSVCLANILILSGMKMRRASDESFTQTRKISSLSTWILKYLATALPGHVWPTFL